MSFVKKFAAVLLSTVIAAVSILAVPAEASNVVNNLYSGRYNLLKQMLKNDTETVQAVKDFGRAVVFLSVSDGSSKAKVFLVQSSNLDKSLSECYAKAKASGVVPKWMKLDVVISDEETDYSDFVFDTSAKRIGGMRNGVAFTPYYGTALLESQLNSSGMINYEEGTLDLARVNKELKSMGKKKLDKIPSTLRVFKTQGYFSENSSYARKLINKTYGDTGRRELAADKSTVEMLADKSSEYLSSICDKDGKFIYGYYPIDNEEMSGYNILRHAGTVWNLIMQYEMCRDESLVPVIDRSLAYLKDSIQYKNKKTAFIIDGSQLNVGGNGLALLAYTLYEEVFGTTKYHSVIRALANGILYMQKSDGSFVHTLNRYTYETSEDYIVIYYDGEATYGLLKAYGTIGDSKFISAAIRAADYFIANDFVKEHSHWMSYAFNEITKYRPYERFFEFGLKNVDTDNFSYNMYNAKAGINSVSETINAAFEMYDRLIRGGYKCKYLEEFNAEQLMKTSVRRAEYGLNYFMFPEYAMYFEAPQTVLNSFAVREDYFRIRIDDIQHFMDGYYLYWKNYDNLQYQMELLKNKAETAAEDEETDDVQTDDLTEQAS